MTAAIVAGLIVTPSAAALLILARLKPQRPHMGQPDESKRGE